MNPDKFFSENDLANLAKAMIAGGACTEQDIDDFIGWATRVAEMRAAVQASIQGYVKVSRTPDGSYLFTLTPKGEEFYHHLTS